MESEEVGPFKKAKEGWSKIVWFWDEGYFRDSAGLLFLGSLIWHCAWNKILYASTSGAIWMCCGDNSGYAASSYLSVTFGLNVALAKWEPFKKSLTDVEAQFKEAFNSEVKKRKLSADVVDEETDEETVIEELCKEPLEVIRVNNSRIWKGSRRWAIFFSCIAIIFLYFHVSGGVWAAIFILPTLIATISAARSKAKVSKMVKEKIQSQQEVRTASRKVLERKAAIENALG